MCPDTLLWTDFHINHGTKNIRTLRRKQRFMFLVCIRDMYAVSNELVLSFPGESPGVRLWGPMVVVMMAAMEVMKLL